MAPMKPPSACFELYCSCALDYLIVATFPLCQVVASFLACCRVIEITCSPRKSECFSFIDTGVFDCMASNFFMLSFAYVDFNFFVFTHILLATEIIFKSV